MAAQSLSGHSHHVVVISKRKVDRYAGAWVAVFFVIMATVGTVGPMVAPSLGTVSPTLELFVWAAVGILCLIAFFMSGPAEIIMDGDRRHYKLVVGTPLFTRKHEGSLDDIAAIICRTIPTKGMDTHQIEIAWSDPTTKSTPITYMRLTDVYPLMDSVSAALGLPVQWIDEKGKVTSR